jgi:acetyl-CoA synthetase
VSPKIFESILVAHAQVSEAAAIGVSDSIKGEALVCCCVLKKGANGDVTLASELKKSVGRDLGKALAPRDVVFVADIPKTRNAKVMRRIVRAAYLGENSATHLPWKTQPHWKKSSGPRRERRRSIGSCFGSQHQ